MRYISADNTDLKAILAEKIPKEQERVKAFRKQHGATKVGEVTVDMVSDDLFYYISFIDLVHVLNAFISK